MDECKPLPVTMRTVTPAPRSSATASAVSGRIGSWQEGHSEPALDRYWSVTDH